MEETLDQINDEVAVDAALDDLSVMTASESEMSSDDQVVSTEVLEANNAMTMSHFVGDNIDLNIVSIHGNTPFHSAGWIRVTSPASPFSDQQITAAVPGVKFKAFDKANPDRS